MNDIDIERPNTWPWWAKFVAFLVGLCALALAALLTFRLTCLSFVDNYELGYTFDWRTGEIAVLDHTGYELVTPWVVSVHTIDLRPTQVCITAKLNTTTQRTLNCKLVKFNPDGLDLFLSWHGRGDYSQDDLSELLKVYAYDGSKQVFPFLTVLKELKSEDVIDVSAGSLLAPPTLPVVVPVTPSDVPAELPTDAAGK